MSSDVRNPFALLGLTPEATDNDIAKAYRRLTREFHPDKNRHDPAKAALAEARMSDISWAKGQIGTSDKRQQWIAAEEERRRQQQSMIGIDLSFLDGQGSASMPRLGQDVDVRVELTFQESFEGKQVQVSFPVDGPCTTCGGTGARPGSAPRPCAQCSGTGTHTVAGSVASVCSACRGRRIQIDHPCEPCSGSGRLKTTKSKVVQILPGVADGQVVRISQEGMPGYQRSGDLVITVKVHPSPVFSRYEGAADLLLEVPVSFPEAAQGSAVTIPTPTGRINMRLLPHTNSGTLLRMRGQGAPIYGDPAKGRGDLFARVMIVVPDELNEQQISLIRQLSVHDEPQQLRQRLFQRVADEINPPAGA